MQSYSDTLFYLSFHSNPQTIRIDKGLKRFIWVRFRHYIGGIILTINLPNLK
jgi:hypothetical protein